MDEKYKGKYWVLVLLMFIFSLPFMSLISIITFNPLIQLPIWFSFVFILPRVFVIFPDTLVFAFLFGVYFVAGMPFFEILTTAADPVAYIIIIWVPASVILSSITMIIKKIYPKKLKFLDLVKGNW